MRNFRYGLLLRAFCIWTLFVWIVLIKNMITATNHSLAFRAIHIGLAVISISLAAAVWPLAKHIRLPHVEKNDD